MRSVTSLTGGDLQWSAMAGQAKMKTNHRFTGGDMIGINQMLDPKTEAHVHIFGPRKLQNELMCEFLERSTGLMCMCWDDSGPPIFDKETDRKSLVLWDCIDKELDTLWLKLDTEFNLQSFIALFNVVPDFEVYKEAVNRGVRGIFFKDEKPYVLTMGVQAILNGELWFSRDILAKCLLETADPMRPPGNSKPRLTLREREILKMLASGSTNDKIAEDLCISPHTVKTHIYNIYKKIHASNRLKAAIWATENL
jgi:DNA-binding CsgD family transcriptional regulator